MAFQAGDQITVQYQGEVQSVTPTALIVRDEFGNMRNVPIDAVSTSVSLAYPENWPPVTGDVWESARTGKSYFVWQGEAAAYFTASDGAVTKFDETRERVPDLTLAYRETP